METIAVLRVWYALSFVILVAQLAPLPLALPLPADAKHSPVMPPAQPHTGDETAADDPAKSWTKEAPCESEQRFLNSLDWEEHPAGNGYTLRLGKIQKWIAGMQFLKDGKTVLSEITPPYEYVTVVDPLTAKPCSYTAPLSRDVNGDGVLEIAFLHRKLHDQHYHMYTVYALQKARPKLLWKSAGELGDWLQKEKQAGPRIHLPQ